jgi:general L-amino acid transport system substrate-binding protein
MIIAIALCSNQKDRNQGKMALAATGDRLTTVKQRGSLICGVNGQLPGFSFVNAEGEYAGLDVDICRAIAVAIFDDPNKVIFRDIKLEERFAILQAGEIDLFSRNTTSTFSRDTTMSLQFLPTTFYDGQGLMVKKNSNIKSLKDLDGKSVCVLLNTTNKDNLSDRMTQLSLKYQPKPQKNNEDLFNNYEQNTCDAVTSDLSQLVVNKLRSI